MRLNEKPRVPVAGTPQALKSFEKSDGARNSGEMTEREKLKLWNMQTAPRPFWRMLAARIWRPPMT